MNKLVCGSCHRSVIWDKNTVKATNMVVGFLIRHPPETHKLIYNNMLYRPEEVAL